MAVPSGLEEVASPFRQRLLGVLGCALLGPRLEKEPLIVCLGGHSPKTLVGPAGRAKPLPQVQKAQPLSRDSLLLLSAYCLLLLDEVEHHSRQ
jgi:hypothetical protein